MERPGFVEKRRREPRATGLTLEIGMARLRRRGERTAVDSQCAARVAREKGMREPSVPAGLV